MGSLLSIADDRIDVVEDGQEISLGDKTLRFYYTPWVHWPETMETHVPEVRVLFSCDFFGSHLATTDLYVTDIGTLTIALVGAAPLSRAAFTISAVSRAFTVNGFSHNTAFPFAIHRSQCRRTHPRPAPPAY